MSLMKPNPLTLTLYPNGYGMGYVISENPKEIINYGVARIRPMTTGKYLKRLKRFIEIYRPSLIIIRDPDGQGRMSKRIRAVLKKFEQQVEELDLPVYKYSRKQITEVFEQFEGSSKYMVSKTIASWYPELNHLLPDIRKHGDSEHYQMGVFDAFALMLCHSYLK